MYACKYSTANVVHSLIKLGANIPKTLLDDVGENLTNRNDIISLLKQYCDQISITNNQQATTIHQTQVGIIGAGPAGLVLSQLLYLSGIESIVLERSSRESIETRIRAGVLEQDTVDLFDYINITKRLHIKGLIYHNMNFQYNSKRYHIPLSKLTNGKVNTVYGQQCVIQDLLETLVDNNFGGIMFEVTGVQISNVQDKYRRSIIRYKTREQKPEEIYCDFIIGCDGSNGTSRQIIPRNIFKTYERIYPFAWLSVIALTEPINNVLIYAYHERGFVIYLRRSKEQARFHLQVDVNDNINNWTDERIWAELHCRLDMKNWTLDEGKIIEKRIFPLRSFMCEPMQYKNLYLAGDIAHLVPPTGAKGLNMAIADVKTLADALRDYYEFGLNEKLDMYSRTCVNRSWRVQDFTNSVTEMWHRYFNTNDGNFGYEIQRARVENLCNSKALQYSFAEMFVGLPTNSNN
ncbi:unnamed protein product, partial [Didymodactylos carnosus]